MVIIWAFLIRCLTVSWRLGVATTENKYRSMPLQELEREWNSVYAHKGFPADPNYDLELSVASNSPNGVLDRIYAERTGRPSWKQKAMKHQQDRLREEQAKQQMVIEKKIEKRDKNKPPRKRSRRNSVSRSNSPRAIWQRSS